MVPNRNAKDKLVAFLDHTVFQPVLSASSQEFSHPSAEKTLDEAQAAMRELRNRYHVEYESAEEVRDHFRNDLDSDRAREVNPKLRALDLPTFEDVSAEFDKRLEQLDVRAAQM